MKDFSALVKVASYVSKLEQMDPPAEKPVSSVSGAGFSMAAALPGGANSPPPYTHVAWTVHSVISVIDCVAVLSAWPTFGGFVGAFVS